MHIFPQNLSIVFQLVNKPLLWKWIAARMVAYLFIVNFQTYINERFRSESNAVFVGKASNMQRIPSNSYVVLIGKPCQRMRLPIGKRIPNNSLLYWEWHLIPKWPLRSIFAWFLERSFSKTWGGPGECSMIDRFLGDAFWVLSCQFWSTVLQCGARVPIHTINCWTVQSVVPGT